MDKRGVEFGKGDRLLFQRRGGHVLLFAFPIKAHEITQRGGDCPKLIELQAATDKEKRLEYAQKK